MAETVDARGLSCPQPVILTRRALGKAGSGCVISLVDTMTSVQNVSRMAQKEGWAVEMEEVGDEFKLILTR